MGVTEKEEGGTTFILSSSSGRAPRRKKQPQSLCAAEGEEFCFSVGLYIGIDANLVVKSLVSR